MANIKLNPMFEGISKKVGDLVFYRKDGRTFVRRKGERTDPNTEAQQQVRSAFTDLVDIWKTFGAPVQAHWDNYAKDKRYTGYNAFIGANSEAQRHGTPIEIAPDIQELQGFTVQQGEPGIIVCSVQASNVTLYVQKVEEDGSNGNVQRHNWGQGTEHILSNNDPGTYHIYAVTRQRPYDQAIEITAQAVQTITIS